MQPPGRENRFREEPYKTYDALADDLGEVLLPYLDRPFGLFGHGESALLGNPRPDLVELSLEILRADVETNKRYHPAEPVRLPCPITALG